MFNSKVKLFLLALFLVIFSGSVGYLGGRQRGYQEGYAEGQVYYEEKLERIFPQAEDEGRIMVLNGTVIETSSEGFKVAAQVEPLTAWEEIQWEQRRQGQWFIVADERATVSRRTELEYVGFSPEQLEAAGVIEAYEVREIDFEDLSPGDKVNVTVGKVADVFTEERLTAREVIVQTDTVKEIRPADLGL